MIANEYGIYIKNTADIKIFKNSITNASKSAIAIENSKNIEINGNNLNNNNHALIIKNSDKINLKKNIIKKNEGNGLTIYSSKNIIISNNIIDENNKSGISIQKTINMQIINNKINKNRINGIELIEKTTNTYISKNNISQSSRGILIDSNSKNDTIVSNNIKTNIENGYSDKYHTAIGILFGYSYNDRNKAPNIHSNAFYGNSRFSIRANMDLTRVSIGSNWYGSNYDSYSGLCPKIKSNLITAKLTNTQNGYKLMFYSNNKLVIDLPSFDVTFYLNGKNPQTTSVVNGFATYKPITSGIVSVWVDRDVISLKGNSNDPGFGDVETGDGLENYGSTDTTTGDSTVCAEQEKIANSAEESSSDSKSGNSENDQGSQAKEIVVEEDSPFKIEDNQYLTYIVLAVIAIIVIIGYFFKKR